MNNPLIYTDPEGEFIFSLLASIIPGAQFLLPIAMAMDMSALSGGANASLNGESFWKGAVSGAILGAGSFITGGAVVNTLNIGGIIPGAAVGGLSGASIGGLGGGLSSWAMGDDFWDGAKRGALTGGIGGILGGGYVGYQIAESGSLNYWWGTKSDTWGYKRGQWSIIPWIDKQDKIVFPDVKNNGRADLNCMSKVFTYYFGGEEADWVIYTNDGDPILTLQNIRKYGSARRYPIQDEFVTYENLKQLSLNGEKSMIDLDNYLGSGRGHAIGVKKVLFVPGKKFDIIGIDPYEGSRVVFRNFKQGINVGENPWIWFIKFID